MRFNPIPVVAAPVMPASQSPERAALIKRISEAARRPCAPIRPSFSTPGWFCYFDEYHNTYYGKAQPSAELALKQWNDSEDKKVAEFAAELEKMTDARLQDQAAYWLDPNRGRPKWETEPKKETKKGKTTRVATPKAGPFAIAIKETIHTKRQCPIWIAQLQERVERKDFNRLREIAKGGGGYWSSFGPVDIHGFIFFEADKAKAFINLVGKLAEPAPVVAQPPPFVAPTPPIVPQTAPVVSQPAPIVAPVAPTAPAWRKRLLAIA